MEIVIAHVQDNAFMYALGALVAIPIIYATRQYSVPILFHTFETIIYMTIFHVVFAGMVRAASWFRNETTMDRAFEETARNDVVWTTPVTRFWDRALYEPANLFYAECVVACVIVFIVVYFRPMKTPTKNKYKGKAAPGAKKKAGLNQTRRYQYQRSGQSGRRR